MPLHFKSINTIQNFGIYQNFAWDIPTLGSLDRYNLVFGYNYSGKTTLSRIFQSIEDGSLSRDYIGGAFEAELSDQTFIRPPFAAKQPLLRVFNRDFVARNFHQTSDMTGANAITVVGETNQLLKDRKQKLNGRIAKLKLFKERLRADSKTIQDALDVAGTAQASTINQLVGGGRYTRASLNADIGQLSQHHTVLPLSATELDQVKERYRRAGDFEKVPTLASSMIAPGSDISVQYWIIRQIRAGLREIATNKALASLKSSRKVEEWVEAGLLLHGEDDACAFCGNPVSADRWQDIQGHFSKAFSALQQKLKAIRDFLGVLVMAPVGVKGNELFPDLRQEFALAVADLQTKGGILATEIAAVASLLESKLNNLESGVDWQPDFSPLRNYIEAVSNLNGIIGRHNTLVEGASDAKAEAKERICLHFTVEHLKTCAFHARRADIAKIDARIARTDQAIIQIAGSIVDVEGQIKTASIGIQKINYYLSLLLRGDIVGNKINDTDFEFLRGGQPARNMSEGERTAVAFSYFLATLEDGGSTVGDLTIIVDDPISSLDENHIYDVYAIVKDVLGKAHQLVVLTHNSYFFGLIKDWMKDKTGGKFKLLMTERLRNPQGAWSSTLVVLPRMLRNFKSTYQQEYYKLKKLNDAPNPSIESLMEVPNLLRGVLEAYLGFMFPEAGGINDKLPKVLADTTKCEAIAKFAHDNSHRHGSMTLGEIQGYTSHCKNVIADAMGAIQAYSPDHVASLEALYLKEAAHLS